jgi:hypothetical protein
MWSMTWRWRVNHRFKQMISHDGLNKLAYQTRWRRAHGICNGPQVVQHLAVERNADRVIGTARAKPDAKFDRFTRMTCGVRSSDFPIALPPWPSDAMNRICSISEHLPRQLRFTGSRSEDHVGCSHGCTSAASRLRTTAAACSWKAAPGVGLARLVSAMRKSAIARRALLQILTV